LLGVSPTGQQRAHLVADIPPLDARAERSYATGTFQTEKWGSTSRRRIVTASLQQVSSVDSSCFDLDHNLAGRYLRIGHLNRAQDVWTTGFARNDGTHRTNTRR
jgi:hypothetical protein